MQFEFDPEALIVEVKKRPGIWDNEDVQHRSKESRAKLWHEVIDVLLQEQKVSKSEQRELELQLQKKWKSLRDAFMKYVNHPLKQRRPYIYAKHLQFLLKTRTSLPETEEVGSSDSDGGTKKYSGWKAKRKMKIVKVQASDDEDDMPAEYLEEDDHPVAKLARTSKSFNNEFAFANVETTISSPAEDCDKMFLLSLLPHLKSIPEDYRLHAKMELLQVLQSANHSAASSHVENINKRERFN